MKYKAVTTFSLSSLLSSTPSTLLLLHLLQSSLPNLFLHLLHFHALIQELEHHILVALYRQTELTGYLHVWKCVCVVKEIERGCFKVTANMHMMRERNNSSIFKIDHQMGDARGSWFCNWHLQWALIENFLCIYNVRLVFLKAFNWFNSTIA